MLLIITAMLIILVILTLHVSRSGSSTAVVLWQPPGGHVPDIISSALRSGPGTCHGYTTQPVTSRAVQYKSRVFHPRMREME